MHLVKQFCQSAFWLCAIFCSEFLSVLFHMLFPTMSRIGCKQQFCRNREKETHHWLWQRLKSWRLEGNVCRRRKIFLKLSDLLFYESITFFFLNRVVTVPPWSVRRFLAFLSFYIELFTLAATLLAGLFIQHSCNYLNWAPALHWAMENIILTPSKDSWPKVSGSLDFAMTVQNINTLLITK